jgi:hypothetical protein
VSFRERWTTPPAPGDDLVVFDIVVPAAAVGAIIAICDGYGDWFMLRSRTGGGAGDYMAWVAPSFVGRTAALWKHLKTRYGVAVAGPRPFAATDMAEGMHVRSDAESPAAD